MPFSYSKTLGVIVFFLQQKKTSEKAYGLPKGLVVQPKPMLKTPRVSSGHVFGEEILSIFFGFGSDSWIFFFRSFGSPQVCRVLTNAFLEWDLDHPNGRIMDESWFVIHPSWESNFGPMVVTISQCF